MPLLIIVKSEPFDGHGMRAAIDMALATAAFDQPLALLFIGDSAGALRSLQGGAIECKDPSKQLAAFELYGIDQLYVAQGSLNNGDAAECIELITDQQLPSFIACFKTVLVF